MAVRRGRGGAGLLPQKQPQVFETAEGPKGVVLEHAIMTTSSEQRAAIRTDHRRAPMHRLLSLLFPSAPKHLMVVARAAIVAAAEEKPDVLDP